MSQPHAPGSEKFGAAPVAGLIATGVPAVVGAGVFLLASTRQAVASCGGDRMAPGELCDTFRNGVRTGTQTYGEVLAHAQRLGTVGTWLGVGLVAVAIVMAVLVVVRWQQDVAMRARLQDPPGTPVSSHSATVMPNLLLVLVGAALLGLAGLLALQGLPTSSVGFFVGAAVAGAAGAATLWFSLPSNGTLVQVLDRGVRVVARNRVADLDWRQVEYRIVPQKGSATHSLRAPGIRTVELAGLTGSELLRGEVARRTVQAKLPVAIEAYRRGEPLTFGPFTVSQQGVGTGSGVVPWPEVGQLTLVQGQVTVGRVPRGKVGSVSLAQIADYSLFAHVLELARTASRGPQHPPGPPGSPPAPTPPPGRPGQV